MEACEPVEIAAGLFARGYLEEVKQIAAGLDAGAIERMALHLAGVRDAGGRGVFLGVGGGAANASQAVDDFRKIAGSESYGPSDTG